MSAVVTDRAAKTTLTVTSTEVAQAGSVDPVNLEAAVPAELARILTKVVAVVAAGGTVTIGSVPSEVTTTTAAQMLDISRPTLMKLIGEGEIPAHKIGTHTRLKSSDVIAYQERLRDAQRVAFDDLRAFEDAEGMAY
ncbi:helix-turn-helix domain-containing protein [Rhodococcus opacus]|uniref:helix-turn-helix domain-containing protein n=1 Tax=Rhodococcus opacus TaxID=37919 RepID=UPI0002F6F20D|nr:helix-turn-helix domain-containing protein [Rhodococcus opacus]MDV6248102.1 helix-turn-helix domain-containing protein [Rhodococcus opacus]RYF26520.1 MAG: DNA-binding protein [Comamonadaceae bacterium]